MRTIAPLRTARGYITHSAEGASNLRRSDALADSSRNVDWLGSVGCALGRESARECDLGYGP